MRRNKYDGAEPFDRPDNLYEPVPGDHGAHGAFGSRASERSYEFWAESHVGLAAACLAALVAGTLWMKRVLD